MVSEALPGPPWVMAKMMSKLFTASIMRIMDAMKRKWHGQWQRDVAEHLPAGGAIDLRALIGLGRNRGEAAEHDQHHQRRPLPGFDQNQGRNHGRGVKYPELRRETDEEKGE